MYVVIEGGLTLNGTEFILVQATCPTSSFSRSMTLFLNPGAQSSGESRILFKGMPLKNFLYNSVSPFQQFGNNYKIDNMIRYIWTK